MKALTFGLIMLPAVCFAQAAEVSGARLTIREERESAITVTLTNRRGAPLVAWELGLLRAGAVRPVNTTRSDYERSGNWRVGDGPLRPGERRTIRVAADDRDADAAGVLVFALFDDGHFEGQRSAAKGLFATRRQTADKLRYWLVATEGPAVGPAGDLRLALAAVLKKAAGTDAVRDTSFASNLTSAVTEPERSDVWLRASLDRLRRDAQDRVAILERPIETSNETVSSVGVESTPTRSRTVFAQVENLRDVALEVFAIRWTKTSGGGGAGMSTDVCCMTEGPGRGPIPRGDSREFPILYGDAQAQNFALEFLLFADLSWEGDPRERDYILRMRELRAADAAFWVPVLTDASLLPPDKAIALLEMKKKERAAATALIRFASYSPFQREVEEIVRRTKRNPADFTRAVHDTIWRLEWYRVQALRHLNETERVKGKG